MATTLLRRWIIEDFIHRKGLKLGLVSGQIGLVLAGVIAKLQTVFAGVANPVREELALGKTEDWVARRTGHCSSIMLAVDETQRHSVNMISIGSLSFTYLATLYSPGAPPST